MSEVTVKNCAIPRARGATLAAMLASSVLLSGCYSTGGHVPDLTRFPESVPSGLLDYDKEEKEGKAAKPKEELPVTKRLALADGGAAKLYSFKAMGQSLRVSLMQFAEANNLNVILDQDVAGIVNVEFHDVTLEQALDALLDPIGLGWVQEDGVIRITRQVTRIYQVDYLRAARTGTASMSATATGQGTTGTNSISKTDSINFWSDLETEIKSLLVKDAETQAPGEAGAAAVSSASAVMVAKRPIEQVEGRVTINRISGTVQVTASPRRMKTVDAYMQNLLKGINRQVYIETRILDVTLNDDAALGIDWTNVSLKSGLKLVGSNIVTATAAGVTAPLPTGILSYNRSFVKGPLSQISAAVQALEQQGTVRVVSQPKVRTLNNQPAIMKVGTDRTFYNVTITPAVLGINGNVISPTTTTETPITVTEGVTLSVTPQISSEGMITLDVMPVVNRIIAIDTSPSGNSNAPRMETKQASTMVRLKDGETTVIGGLIQEEDSESDRHLPGMGDLPLAGWLFKGKYTHKVRKELVIFITPHLIEN